VTHAPKVRPPEAKPAMVVPDTSGPPANIVAYHYEAKPQAAESATAPAILPSTPPPARMGHTGPTGRTAWKRTGPTIGKASGILLLALAGIAILGVLFVVFSLME
jgi:hypothetical protein